MLKGKCKGKQNRAWGTGKLPLFHLPLYLYKLAMTLEKPQCMPGIVSVLPNCSDWEKHLQRTRSDRQG